MQLRNVISGVREYHRSIISAIVKLPVADRLSNEFAFSPLNSAKTDLEAYVLCQQMEN